MLQDAINRVDLIKNKNLAGHSGTFLKMEAKTGESQKVGGQLATKWVPGQPVWKKKNSWKLHF